jgi:transcriptional regulator HMO1
MTQPVSHDQFKAAKDSLIASLVELSKAAQQVSHDAIDFFNIVDATASVATPAITTPLFSTATATTTATAPLKRTRKTAVKKIQNITVPVDEDVNVDEDIINTLQNSTLPDTPYVAVPSDVAIPEITGTDAIPVVEEPEKKQRKKRAPKDPNAPKKPLTSYILFYNHLRSTVAQQNTSLSQTDLAKEISRQWKEMSDEDKHHWKQLYDMEKVKYDQEMAKYKKRSADEAEMNSIVVDEDDYAHAIANAVAETPVESNLVNEIQDQPIAKKSKKSRKSKKLQASA